MTFNKFVLMHLKDNNANSDFAQDWQHDKHSIKRNKKLTKDTLKSYLSQKGASEDCIKIANSLYNLWILI